MAVEEEGPLVLSGDVAGTVLRYVLRGIDADARRDGGEVTPAARRLLADLAAAARHGHSSDTGTAVVPHDTLGSVTATEAAELLECSPEWVRRLCRTGRVDARRTIGGWLVDAASLQRYRTRRAA